jgi:DNA-binding MarR family transcriptional regulator
MAFVLDEKTVRAVRAYENLMYAAKSVGRLLGEQLDSFGLTESQLRTLEWLVKLGPMSLVDVCDRVLRGSSDMTVMTKNLESRGLVTRRKNETDRRLTMIQVTTEGKKLLLRILPMRARLIKAQMAVLGKPEQEKLARLCEKLGRGDVLKYVRELTRVDGDEG